MNIDQFRELISHYGLNPEEALKVIKDIYLAGELPREVCQGDIYSDKIFCNELYKVPRELLEVLKSLRVVNEHVIGTYGAYGRVWSDFKAKRISLEEADKLIKLSGRVWILTLTDIGKRIAIQYLDNLLENSRDLIINIINEYNSQLLGFLRYLSSDKVQYVKVNEYFEEKPYL